MRTGYSPRNVSCSSRVDRICPPVTPSAAWPTIPTRFHCAPVRHGGGGGYAARDSEMRKICARARGKPVRHRHREAGVRRRRRSGHLRASSCPGEGERAEGSLGKWIGAGWTSEPITELFIYMKRRTESGTEGGSQWAIKIKKIEAVSAKDGSRPARMWRGCGVE